MSIVPRKRLFVDARVQGILLIRALIYWLAVLTTIGILTISWAMLSGPERPLIDTIEDVWTNYRLPLIAAVMVLPLMIGDVVKVSNRFVGPIYRLRKGLRALGHGEPLKMMQFREGDFWRDMADEFNAVAARIERLERRLAWAEGVSKDGATQTENPVHETAVETHAGV